VVRGGKLVTEMAASGTIFGEMSLILGKGRTATVTAAEPCDCLVVDMGYVDFLPSPEREDFLIRIFAGWRPSSPTGSARPTPARPKSSRPSGNAGPALREIVARETAVIAALRRELDSLNTEDDEAVLRQLLDRRF